MRAEKDGENLREEKEIMSHTRSELKQSLSLS